MSKRTSAAGITARGTRGKKKEERARSPQLTGGEGFTYEDVIAAYFLAALLREEAALAQPGLVTRVAVQQDRQGEPMDDVIVESDAAGERYRLSLQVKRSVTVSASNADFQNSSPKRSRPALSPISGPVSIDTDSLPARSAMSASNRWNGSSPGRKRARPARNSMLVSDLVAKAARTISRSATSSPG